MSKKEGEKQDVKDIAQEAKTPVVEEFALLFELENIVVEGRSVVFDVLNSILSEQGAELTQSAFSRFCTRSAPARYMAELLATIGAKKISAEKTIEDLDSGLAMFYASADLALKPGVLEVLKAAKGMGVALGAISGLPKEIAETVISRMKLDELNVSLVSFSGRDDASPRADTWMMMAKAMSKSTRRCVAIGSSSLACKAALSAGMRSVALPDRFTDYQDFGGAEMISGSMASVNPKKLLAGLFPAAGE
ncbi:MAG: HAD family hydrolase [Spartobacteria bacterium]|nr:HAD family hydrolase [Spartobacteria bacterium]